MSEYSCVSAAKDHQRVALPAGLKSACLVLPVWTHQSVDDSSNCSVEHVQPRHLLSNRRKRVKMQPVARIHTPPHWESTGENKGSASPHILEGEDDGGDDPDDHQHHGSNTQKPPTRGEVHLRWGKMSITGLRWSRDYNHRGPKMVQNRPSPSAVASGKLGLQLLSWIFKVCVTL